MAESKIKVIATPIELGFSGVSIQSNLETNWQTKIPNSGLPTLVKINALYGARMGFLSRYSGSYGSGILTRYDGGVEAVFLNNGTVTIKTL